MSEQAKKQVMAFLNEHIDPSVFEYAVGIYQSAAMGELHGSHIGKPDPSAKPGWVLTNTPMNRGMLAVMNETRHLSQKQRLGLSYRLLAFGAAIESAVADGRFHKHVIRNEEFTSVSDDFRNAYANCRFVAIGEDREEVDLDQIWSVIKDTDPAA